MTTTGATDALETCPSGISLVGSTATALHGWSLGDTTVYLDSCPADRAVIGYTLYPAPTFEWVFQIQTLCGTLFITRGQTDCPIAITSSVTLPLRGLSYNTQPVVQQCPSDQMVVAVRGRSGDYLDQLAFGCAPLTLTSVGLTFQPTLGAITWLPPLGGAGGSAFEDGCTAGSVATGSNISTWNGNGDFVTFGMLCSAPVVVP